MIRVLVETSAERVWRDFQSAEEAVDWFCEASESLRLSGVPGTVTACSAEGPVMQQTIEAEPGSAFADSTSEFPPARPFPNREVH